MCGVYGNLTGVWFSKRAEDFARGKCSFAVYGGAREVQGGGRVYDCDGDIKTQYPAERESAT